MTTQTAFTAPGPGSWQLDAAHFPRAITRLFGEVFPRAFDSEFRGAVRAYGSLLETLEFKAVNGFMYFAPRPVGAPKGAKGPPPKAIFKLLLLIHPEIRRRVATTGAAFANRLWREDLRRWDEETKPAAIRAHLALQAVDLRALSTDALVAHLQQCLEHWGRMIGQHHRLDPAAILPVGDFIARTADWTGLPPARICALLRGASDVSSGASPELDRLRAALQADPASRGLIGGGRSAADVIAALRTADGELGAAARGWLDLVSHRLQNGLDICELTNIETPELLVTTIRQALAGAAAARPVRDAPDVAAVRDRVPAEHRATWSELLAEARLVYRLRDERGLYSDIWAAGIMRRGLLEAGRRLVAERRLARPELVLEAGWDEIRALIAGGAAPSSDELAARARYRATTSPQDAPALLGGPKMGPPPFDWMPPASARTERALASAIDGIFEDSTAPSESRVVRGLGVSAGVVEGTARVLLDVNEFGKLQQGDILVTRATTAAFNVVLPLLSGIVTDRGGTLSHSAIVAREYGIPAVVGSREATRIIPDGARLRLNGDLGEVHVL
jgi:pyruvate,water dikinase